MCSSNHKQKTPEIMPLLPKRNINSKYKHLKSRYLEKSKVVEKQPRMAYNTKERDIVKIKTVNSSLQLESDSKKLKTVQKLLIFGDRCFVEQSKNDDDLHSSIMNLILNTDIVRQAKKHEYKCGPSIRFEPDLLTAVHDLLKVSKSPTDMLHAVFFASRYERGDAKEDMEQSPDDWMWVAEAILNVVLILNDRSPDYSNDDERRESAVCWYAAAVFYSRIDRIRKEVIEYLKKARTIIANGANRLWKLPDDLRLTMGLKPDEPLSVWTLASLHQIYLLRKIAIHQEPDKAVRTLQYACELLESSGEPDNIPAEILKVKVQYDLGHRYKALGSHNLSVNAFHECARAAKNGQCELYLEAKIMVAQMDPNPPENWSLQNLKEEAKKILNFRLLIKTIVAQGLVAKKKELFEEGFHHFALALELSRQMSMQNADALDKEIALFDMAICLTERHIRMFPISKNVDPSPFKKSYQWTDPVEIQMYHRAKKEAQHLCKLFGDIQDESDDDEQLSENGVEFSNNSEEFTVNDEELQL